MVLRLRQIVIFGLILVMFSSIVLSLTNIQSFVSGNNVELSFSGASNRTASVSTWSNSYLMNVSMVLTGLLSDWVVETSYSDLNSPQDAEYVTASKWVIADTSNSRILIVNPTNNNGIDILIK